MLYFGDEGLEAAAVLDVVVEHVVLVGLAVGVVEDDGHVRLDGDAGVVAVGQGVAQNIPDAAFFSSTQVQSLTWMCAVCSRTFCQYSHGSCLGHGCGLERSALKMGLAVSNTHLRSGTFSSNSPPCCQLMPPWFMQFS